MTYETMKENFLKHNRVWLVVAVVLLIAGHVTLLYYISSHVALAAIIIPGVLILAAIKLIVIKHRRAPSGSHSPLRHHKSSDDQPDESWKPGQRNQVK